MDAAPGILAITGEPTRNERVENLIKLTLSLQMRGGRPAPWRSAFVPFGVFNTVRNLVVLTGSVADPWPHPDAPALLCSVSVVTEARAPATSTPSTASATTPGTPQNSQTPQQQQQQQTQAPGGEGTLLVPATPCSRCAAREVRKLSTLPVAERTAGRDGEGTAEAGGAAVPLTQRLDSVMARSMVVYHSDPEIVFGKCGAASFTLKFRIVCYSTHHGRLPYRVVVSLYDSATRTLVAQQKSLPITILDNHKSRPSVPVSPAPVPAPALETPAPVSAPNLAPATAVSGIKRPPPSPPLTATAAATAVLAAPPTVTRVVPSSGSVAGGTPVVVLGTGLGSTSSSTSSSTGTLTFGGAAAADVHAHTDGALVCTLPPAQHAGPVAVAVGTAPAPEAFTYIDDLDERLWALARAIVLDGTAETAASASSIASTSTTIPGVNTDALNAARLVLGGRVCGGGVGGDEDSVETVLVRVLEPLLAGAGREALAWTRREAETRRTLLHYAAARGYCRLGTALLDAVPALRDATDALGCTALHHAAMRGRGDFSLLLLLRKASVRARDVFGMTPEAYEQHCATGSALLAGPLAPLSTTTTTTTTTLLTTDDNSNNSNSNGNSSTSGGTSFLRYDDGTGMLEDNDPLLLFSHGRDEPDDGWVIIPPAKVLAAADDADTTPGDWARTHFPHIFLAGTVAVLGTVAVCVAATSGSAQLRHSRHHRSDSGGDAGGLVATAAEVHQQQHDYGDVVRCGVLAAVAVGVFVAAALASVARWARRVRVPLVGTGVAALVLAVHQIATLVCDRLSSVSASSLALTQ